MAGKDALCDTATGNQRKSEPALGLCNEQTTETWTSLDQTSYIPILQAECGGLRPMSMRLFWDEFGCSVFRKSAL